MATVPSPTLDQLRLDRRLVAAGVREMAPVGLFVIVFGAAFGLAATQVGLDPGLSTVMSVVVFAGGAQFAVLDFWGPQLSIMTLVLTVFAVNARHLLMGATLYPWLRELSTKQRYGVMTLISDANWAMAMQTFNRGQPGFGLVVGGGLVLWSAWIIGTVLGTQAGSLIADAQRWSLDMVMGCFLLAMAIGGRRDGRLVVIWCVAAAASVLAYLYLPENSHVIVGAVVGGLLGLFWKERAHAK